MTSTTETLERMETPQTLSLVSTRLREFNEDTISTATNDSKDTIVQLYLQLNYLSSFALPASSKPFRMDHLETLVISVNCLTCFPDLSGAPKLTHLYLNNNEITELNPKYLSELKNVSTLCMTSNHLIVTLTNPTT